MTFSKKLQAFALLSAAASMAVIPAFAQTSDTTNVTLTITGGNLSINIPNTSYALSGVTLASSVQNSTANIVDVELADTRGSLAGWAANYNLTNLRGQTDNTKYILLASDVTANFGTAVKYLTVTNSNVAVIAGTDEVADLTSYTSAQEIGDLTELDNTGVSNNFNLLTAPAGYGAGTYNVDIGISLNIPPFGQYPGGQNITAQSYQGTLTASIS